MNVSRLRTTARAVVLPLIFGLVVPQAELMAQERKSRGSVRSANREGNTTSWSGRRASGTTTRTRTEDTATRSTTAQTRSGETVTGSTTAQREGDQVKVEKTVESTSGASRTVSTEAKPGEVERETSTTDRYGRTVETQGQAERIGPGAAEFERTVEGPAGQEKEIEGVAARGYYGRGVVADVEGGRYGDRTVAAGQYYGGRPWVATMPAGYRPVTYYGRPYYAYGGYYYRPVHGVYVVVPPPYGAYYSSPPVGAIVVTMAAMTLLYSQGTYYKKTTQQGTASYQVVPAPSGATLTELPTGSASVTAAGATYYYYANTFYKQMAPQSFVVVAKPAGVVATAALPADVEPVEGGGVTYFVSAGDHYLPYLEPTGQELYIRVNAPLAAAAGAVTTKSVPLTVASGASLKVRLATTLDSGKNKAGDAFEGHLDSDLVAQGQIVATKGSRVQGKVREAKHAEGSQAPLLALELTSVASGGKMIPITTNVTQSQGKAPQTGKKLLGGAAIGATIGAIADGGEGAAVGGIAGAMVGVVAGAATTKEVTLPGGTVLEFQTNQAATFYKNVTVQKSAEP